MINCIIIDDEKPARDLLGHLCSKVSSLNVIRSYKSPLDAVDLLATGQVDLVFLDIQMEEMKGTDFLRTLDVFPEVILTTAYPDYALEGYDLNITDYLLKPISFERFLLGVNRSLERIKLKKADSARKPRLLKIKDDRKVFRIYDNEILYIQGLREYVSYYIKNGRRIIALQSMKDVASSLNGPFVRIHRSFIVRIDQVRYIEGNSVIIDDKRLPIGASYKEKALSVLT